MKYNYFGKLRSIISKLYVALPLSKPILLGFWVTKKGKDLLWLAFKYEKLSHICYKYNIIGHDIRLYVLGPMLRFLLGSHDKTSYLFGDWLYTESHVTTSKHVQWFFT